ncbi:MAG: RHS repeat-associated core domain-containing protein [Chloroflexi bacterium]|nr:RHS repeat-associated core domain-containing protein [Chloroflexota bacterium]
MKKSGDLRYIHQDHLTGTALVTSDNGTLVGSIKYTPYGSQRSSTGTIETDKKFTGQRLDLTGLYYYNARYYDTEIGRFISPDPFVQWSSGSNLVSFALSVNVIPLGLGTVDNPRVSYPRSVLLVPVDPQELNRYSYVQNNPMVYIDPTGYYDLKKAATGAVIIIVADIVIGVPLHWILFASGPAMPALAPIVEWYDRLVVLPATILGIYLIAQGLRDTSDSPELPSKSEPVPIIPPQPTPSPGMGDFSSNTAPGSDTGSMADSGNDALPPKGNDDVYTIGDDGTIQVISDEDAFQQGIDQMSQMGW